MGDEDDSHPLLSPRVKTLYNHRKEGPMIPQVLRTKTIQVESKRYVPRQAPVMTRSGHGIQSEDPTRPRPKFVPRVPTLSPNSFSESWRRRETEQVGLWTDLGSWELKAKEEEQEDQALDSGDSARLHEHYSFKPVTPPYTTEPALEAIPSWVPRAHPVTLTPPPTANLWDSIPSPSEVIPCPPEVIPSPPEAIPSPSDVIPSPPEAIPSPTDVIPLLNDTNIPPTAAAVTPPATATPEPSSGTTSSESRSSATTATSSSSSSSEESLTGFQDKDHETIVDLFKVQSVEELDTAGFEPNPKAVKKYYEITGRKGVVHFELKANEIQNNLAAFVKCPAAIGFEIKCRITRDKKGVDRNIYPTYFLNMEIGKRRILVLTARKRKKSATSNYLISIDPADMSREGKGYVGKLRANLMGTQFSIYDSGSSPKKLTFSQLGCDMFKYREELGTIIYGTNLLGLKGPRKMRVLLPAMMNESQRFEIKPEGDYASILEQGKKDPLNGVVELRNKTPIWNLEHQSFVLNFNGRVTHASVKNFQIIHKTWEDYVVLQFGRVDEDGFTLDFRYPLCPLQAFALALSSFDHKLGCE